MYKVQRRHHHTLISQHGHGAVRRPFEAKGEWSGVRRVHMARYLRKVFFLLRCVLQVSGRNGCHGCVVRGCVYYAFLLATTPNSLTCFALRQSKRYCMAMRLTGWKSGLCTNYKVRMAYHNLYQQRETKLGLVQELAQCFEWSPLIEFGRTTEQREGGGYLPCDVSIKVFQLDSFIHWLF